MNGVVGLRVSPNPHSWSKGDLAFALMYRNCLFEAILDASMATSRELIDEYNQLLGLIAQLSDAKEGTVYRLKDVAKE